MRLIFDSNIIVSAALFYNSKPAVALRIAELKFDLLISTEIIEELEAVFRKEKFDKYTSFANRQDFLTNYIARSELKDANIKITDCRDPKDNKFLELAIDGKADYIITGDEDLLVLHPYQNVSILTPAAFLELLIQSVEK
jgi:putative PIN family toxin of toxin-antitoxin system